MHGHTYDQYMGSIYYALALEMSRMGAYCDHSLPICMAMHMIQDIGRQLLYVGSRQGVVPMCRMKN
jgi:hypothetical protein